MLIVCLSLLLVRKREEFHDTTLQWMREKEKWRIHHCWHSSWILFCLHFSFLCLSDRCRSFCSSFGSIGGGGGGAYGFFLLFLHHCQLSLYSLLFLLLLFFVCHAKVDSFFLISPLQLSTRQLEFNDSWKVVVSSSSQCYFTFEPKKNTAKISDRDDGNAHTVC